MPYIFTAINAVIVGGLVFLPNFDTGWLRVDPRLRQETESVLRPGESLSQLIEPTAVHTQVELRKANEAFVARGLAARDQARQTGHYVEADIVLSKLLARLEATKARSGRT